ncbi:adenylate/guanylate cyclase domain-containing protein [Aeromicrobium wangtongii]|uniref:adenylate/guanylate cyclase domain-containing protein n=1 Tax=Aeromicrobium wangtongii TaxID=2969247 RepID=UPI00201805CF|nr:adenylate/guanylate cyclase domain-containing protein [Aeromicrobium wangtongii]MCL3817262.1 adenylate/guanylate cyclase domain-containing protein [Aeromicrobium wangtongii]
MTARRFGSEWLVGPPDQPSGRLRIRVQVVLTTLLVSTNVIGAAIVFGITFLVTPGGGPNAAYLGALAIAVPVYVGVAVLIGTGTITVSALRTLRWSIEDQEPTARERRTTLRLPWRLTLVQTVLWLGGLVIFTVIAAVKQPEAVLGAVFAVGIAGLVVSAIAYLFTEFVLRPVAARALQGRADADEMGAGVERRMLLFWGLGTAAPMLGLVVAALAAITRDDTSIRRLAFIVLGLAAVVLLFGLLVTVLNARSVVAPIDAVQQAMARVADGDLDVEVRVDDGTELGLLQSGFNEMAQGLREREQIRELFGRHVGRAVAQAATDGEVELGGETRVVSVLMVDLIGSTTYAASRSPAEVVAVLNRFFSVIVEEVDAHSGLVNKFMGDAVLAIFGAPVHLDDHAGAALASARRIAARLDQEVPEIGAGIGVSTGQAVAGNVGHRSRFEYTVIGDAVNAAARLTELAKDVDGHVLVASASVTASGPDEQAFWQPHGSPVLRGREEPTPVCVLA